MKYVSLLLVAIGFSVHTSQLHAQVLEDVVTGLNNPYGLLIIGNDLYFTEYNGDRISKIDLTAPEPVAEVIVTGLDSPSRLLLIGNDLYFSEFNAFRISKIDITEPNPIPTEVLGNLNRPDGLLLNGNDLYIAAYLSKI